MLNVTINFFNIYGYLLWEWPTCPGNDKISTLAHEWTSLHWPEVSSVNLPRSCHCSDCYFCRINANMSRVEHGHMVEVMLMSAFSTMLCNIFYTPRTPGLQKSDSANSSCRSFWIGVPVSTTRRVTDKLLVSCHTIQTNATIFSISLWMLNCLCNLLTLSFWAESDGAAKG